MALQHKIIVNRGLKRASLSQTPNSTRT